MVLTLLVDLDDTLLGNAMEVFIPAYLRALGNHLSDVIPPETLVSSMLDATQSMFLNQQPDQTLKQAFDSDFYPAIGIPEESLRDRIYQFYATDFGNLRKFTQFRSEAIPFIETARRKGYRVIIATNPLFPRTAILQRLEWAGFPQDKYRFQLIPSYETFHFAKPNPAFFAELLTRAGWPHGPMLMVGNDPDHDVNGSYLLGIPSFWITNEEEKYPNDKPKPDSQGALEEVVPWVDRIGLKGLMPNFKTLTAMTAILRGVPAGISTILSPFHKDPPPGEPEDTRLKLSEAVRTLRDLEIDENLPTLAKILNGKNPTMPLAGRKISSRKSNSESQSTFSQYLQARIVTLELLNASNDHNGSVESDDIISAPTSLHEFLVFMVHREINLSRQVLELSNLLIPPK